MASWPGDSNTYPNETNGVELNCLHASTSISISTEISSTIGGNMVLTGQLTDQYGDNLNDELVTLSYKSSGAAGWTAISSNRTNTGGRYSIAWAPTAGGYYDLKAEWAGNATHSASVKTTTVSTLYYRTQYVFAVESNSSVSQLTFNETSKSIRFHASGPNGTLGYAKVSFAKGLVNDATKMKLFVDNTEKTFTSSSSADSWLLIFDYSHSTHEIIVNLSPSIPAVDQTSGFPWTLFYFLLSVASAATGLFVWRSQHRQSRAILPRDKGAKTLDNPQKTDCSN
jgi:hypothetical protein